MEAKLTLTHEELKQAAQPLLEILYKHFHPHATIIVTQGDVEVVEGVISAPFELRD